MKNVEMNLQSLKGNQSINSEKEFVLRAFIRSISSSGKAFRYLTTNQLNDTPRDLNIHCILIKIIGFN